MLVAVHQMVSRLVGLLAIGWIRLRIRLSCPNCRNAAVVEAPTTSIDRPCEGRRPAAGLHGVNGMRDKWRGMHLRPTATRKNG